MSELIILNSKVLESYNNSSIDDRIEHVLRNLNDLKLKDFFVFNDILKSVKKVVICSSSNNINVIEKYLLNFKINFSLIDNFFSIRNNISIAEFEIDKIFVKDFILFVNDDFIFGGKAKFDSIDYFLVKNKNINCDDFIVHEKYGVGIFRDVIKMQNNEGIIQEFIKLEYANETILYLSLHNWKNIFLYQNNDSGSVELDSIKSHSWEKKKEKARSKIKDLAHKIIKNEAKRLNIQKNETILYEVESFLNEIKVFQDLFQFKYTDGQERAISEIFSDLSKGKPMDRLLVADVGFGKTEVIMNAMLLVALNKKNKKHHQSIIVCPTLVLASQHYKTFQQRFSTFEDIKIGIISGFSSKQKQEAERLKFEEGQIDILICTHTIFHGKINMSNVGLVVFDEEHMFGVEQKEKIKLLKSNIHILSSSATPIPRTLQSALLSIRDMSIIETPPQNRVDVKTEILDYNETKKVEKIIIDEINRGYQVVIISGKIEDLPSVENFVKNILKNDEYITLHGQMEKDYIEKKIYDFCDFKYKVLISTTIVTLGSDFENANTIIVNRPENFGLSQLHQIRGRVGRRNRQSYCYILTEKEKNLSENTKKRIDAIVEFNKVGSGFSISSIDMDIRGAGNLLGKEQKGHIIEVGLSLYTKILQEEISRLNVKNHLNFDDDYEIEIKSNVEKFIPDNYIKCHEEKFRVYREIYNIFDMNALYNKERELQRLYGEIPKEVRNIFIDIEMKIKLKNLNIESIDINDSRIKIFFKKDTNIDVQKIISIAKKNEKCYLSPDMSFVIKKNEISDYRANLILIVEIFS